MFVAPVTVGDGAYTGAGSVIRRDVPAGALGVSGSPQRNIDGWTERRRGGTAAADAAAAARTSLGSQAQAQLADHGAAANTDHATPPPLPGVDGALDSLSSTD
jgi:bifunctional UDP-N-acetylglucosamine pyrophosphorylase/glucosamine-1-phosphate N-acetyltransferase